MLNTNLILSTDSYKASHAGFYPKHVTGMYSYIEPRVSSKETIVPFGLQMFLKKYLTKKICMRHIDEAEEFFKAHGEPFDRAPWEKVINAWQGYLPVLIRAVPEGLPIPGGLPLVNIISFDPELFWLPSWLETSLQRAVWYPTTIASLDYNFKLSLKHMYNHTGADMAGLPFALHDFGGRGVTCAEQAEIGGAAHLVNFFGSDTVEGVRAMNYYYNSNMSGFSVPATEHNIEIAYGNEGEKEYLKNAITAYAGKSYGIVSIVIDGYDVYRAAETLCSEEFKTLIRNSGLKVVFRPDSGDMMQVVPRILDMQARAYGTTINGKGYHKINTVGLLQGDGVSRTSAMQLLELLERNQLAADNVVFGSGGSLLQAMTRDTYKFAQKASAMMIDGKWVGVKKSPITDPGKTSKSGLVTTVRSRMTGEYMCVNNGFNENEFEDVMQLVYFNGSLFSTTTLAEIRDRCKV